VVLLHGARDIPKFYYMLMALAIVTIVHSVYQVPHLHATYTKFVLIMVIWMSNGTANKFRDPDVHFKSSGTYWRHGTSLGTAGLFYFYYYH